MLFLVQSVFVLFFILNVSLAKLSVGIPLKDLTLLGLFGLLLLGYPRQIFEVITRHRGFLSIFFALGVVGVCLTILNRDGISVAFQAIPRMMIQPFLIITCSYALASLCGVRFVAGVFIGFALLSGVFAIFQFADIDFAWSVREAFSSIQNEPHSLASYVRARVRPVGISLTAIIYSYHLVAAYITANLLYRRGMMGNRIYYIFLTAVLLMAAANGTRSLLFGIMLHEVLRHFINFNLRTVVALVFLGAVAYFGLQYLESVGSRVATLSDASAIGRLTLYEYGLQLAKDNPFGYGWDFNPGDYAWLYWDQLSDMARAEAAFRLEIHNGYLNFFLKYGFYGVLIIVLAFVLNPALFVASMYFSVAYLAHSFFHNDGIFLGDDYFWFAYAIFLFLRDRDKVQEHLAPAVVVPRPEFRLGLSRAGMTRS